MEIVLTDRAFATATTHTAETLPTKCSLYASVPLFGARVYVTDEKQPGSLSDGLRAALTNERATKRRVLSALPDLLVSWYDAHKRDLPWRHTSDPYRIWLSEIMLQQTRVEAAKGYYLRFVDALPDVRALSNCPDDALMKLWEGLGYYSRARNLKKAAALLADKGFPADRAGWQALPGVGSYTAGAIASIALRQPEAAVDGNVLRVVARAAECYPTTDDGKWRDELTRALSAVYPTEHTAAFTQSFMDLSTAVCLPAAPKCDDCPLCGVCLARARGTTNSLPVRGKKTTKTTERLTVFVLTDGERYALEKRPDAGLLAGLWQFPNVPGHLDESAALRRLADWGLRPDGAFVRRTAKHVFTHKIWDMTVYDVPVETPAGSFLWTDLSAAAALPTAFRVCLG